MTTKLLPNAVDSLAEAVDAACAEMDKLRNQKRELTEALNYALECLTRPDEVDPIYRMETICRVKTAIRGGQ